MVNSATVGKQLFNYTNLPHGLLNICDVSLYGVLVEYGLGGLRQHTVPRRLVTLKVTNHESHNQYLDLIKIKILLTCDITLYTSK